jgi:hypothetical protein
MEEEKQLIQNVRDLVKDCVANKPHLQFFCTDQCILRYLRARHMDVHKASSMIEETLAWCVPFDRIEGAVLHATEVRDLSSSLSIADCN